MKATVKYSRTVFTGFLKQVSKSKPPEGQEVCTQAQLPQCVLYFRAVLVHSRRHREHTSAPVPVPSFTSSKNCNSCSLPFPHRCHLGGKSNTFRSSACFVRITSFQWRSRIHSSHWPVLSPNTVQPLPQPQSIGPQACFPESGQESRPPEKSHGL